MTDERPLVEVENLKKHFPVRKGVFRRTRGYVKAVDGIDLFVNEGEIVGLVGESGCGKTTAGRSILRLTPPTAGAVRFRSKTLAGPNERHRTVDVATATGAELRKLRRDMQIIFQDPYSSLDPRISVAGIVGEPLYVHGIAKGSELRDRVRDLLVAVGLAPEHMDRYAHEFSGGQRQRIGIARALALRPQFVTADEPISALDVSIQAQVINLLKDLQEEFDLTYLVIAHDLSVVRYLCDRVAVMYLGRIVELATSEELFSAPKHPYTEALISAVPVPDPHLRMEQIILEGDVPSPLNQPTGCHFHPRCRYATGVCRNERPTYRDLGGQHFVSCHLAETLDLRPARTA